MSSIPTQPPVPASERWWAAECEAAAAEMRATLEGRSGAWRNVQPCVLACLRLLAGTAAPELQRGASALREEAGRLRQTLDVLLADRDAKEERYTIDREAQGDWMEAVEARLRRVEKQQQEQLQLQQRLAEGTTPFPLLDTNSSVKQPFYTPTPSNAATGVQHQQQQQQQQQQQLSPSTQPAACPCECYRCPCHRHRRVKPSPDFSSASPAGGNRSPSASSSFSSSSSFTDMMAEEEAGDGGHGPGRSRHASHHGGGRGQQSQRPEPQRPSRRRRSDSPTARTASAEANAKRLRREVRRLRRQWADYSALQAGAAHRSGTAGTDDAPSAPQWGQPAVVSSLPAALTSGDGALVRLLLVAGGGGGGGRSGRESHGDCCGVPDSLLATRDAAGRSARLPWAELCVLSGGAWVPVAGRAPSPARSPSRRGPPAPSAAQRPRMPGWLAWRRPQTVLVTAAGVYRATVVLSVRHRTAAAAAAAVNSPISVCVLVNGGEVGALLPAAAGGSAGVTVTTYTPVAPVPAAAAHAANPASPSPGSLSSSPTGAAAIPRWRPCCPARLLSTHALSQLVSLPGGGAAVEVCCRGVQCGQHVTAGFLELERVL